MKFNLQLFAGATPIDGKKIIYLFRILGDLTAAAVMAFTTENERSVSNESDTIATKDGDIVMPEIETEISTTAILAAGDTMAEKLEDAMIAAKKIEIWEANLAETGTASGTFKGRYYQGYLTEFTLTSSAEDHAEYECTFKTDEGKKGDVTVTAAQQEAAEYVFTDTKSTGA